MNTNSSIGGDAWLLLLSKGMPTWKLRKALQDCECQTISLNKDLLQNEKDRCIQI